MLKRNNAHLFKPCSQPLKRERIETTIVEPMVELIVVVRNWSTLTNIVSVLKEYICSTPELMTSRKCSCELSNFDDVVGANPWFPALLDSNS